MAPIVAFPKLALYMRSVSTTRALQLIKLLARLVGCAVQIRKGNIPSSSIANVKEAIAQYQPEDRTQHGTPDHSHAQVDMSEVFDFVLMHVEPSVLDGTVGRSGNTPASEWLVKCALGAEPHLNEPFHWIWMSYLTEQPHYAASIFNHHSYHEWRASQFDAHALTSTFPGLQHALSHFPNDADALRFVLYEYWRLAATAAAMWEHIWEEHGTQRGEPLPSDDSHIEMTLTAIRKHCRRDLRDWTSPTPLRVRRVLAQCDFETDFMLLANHVLPRVIAPHGSSVEDAEFGWALWEWVNGAAVRCRVAIPVVNQHGDAVLRDDDRAFFRPNGCEEHVLYHSPALDDLDEDVELEPFGPSNKVLDYASAVLGLPAAETCTICLDDLGTGDIAMGAVELQVCGHVFHLDCLDLWMNGSHSARKVSCPNCRTKICDARPRRVSPSSEEE
jgi:hypothetical protein